MTLIQATVSGINALIIVTLSSESANQYLVTIQRDDKECFSSNHQSLESALELFTSIQENIAMLKSVGAI